MYKIIFKKLLQQNSHPTHIAKSGLKFRCTMMTSRDGATWGPKGALVPTDSKKNKLE